MVNGKALYEASKINYQNKIPVNKTTGDMSSMPEQLWRHKILLLESVLQSDRYSCDAFDQPGSKLQQSTAAIYFTALIVRLKKPVEVLGEVRIAMKLKTILCEHNHG